MSTVSKKPDRKLGDEWLDWDGRSESTDTSKKVFLGMAALSILMLAAASALAYWLILPRLNSLGRFWTDAVAIMLITVTAALIAWIVTLTIVVALNRPAPKGILMPSLMNRMLSLVSSTGRMLGISTDRITNSFLKVHNLLLRAKPPVVEPKRLLVLAPRCLTRENNKTLRQLRDQYGFQMAVVGGGTEARQHIRQTRPQMIIAMACERDLLSGFKEVNPSIPVIGFPNERPEGPCKNTCVDMRQIEQTVVKCLHTTPESSYGKDNPG